MVEVVWTVLFDDNAMGNKTKLRTNINALLESCSTLCYFLTLRVGGYGNKSFQQNSPYGDFIMCDQDKTITVTSPWVYISVILIRNKNVFIPSDACHDFFLAVPKSPILFLCAVTESLNQNYEVWTSKECRELHALHILSSTLPELLLFWWETHKVTQIQS